jgi:tRNA A37 threonylcarbamoyladenosine biosynthesis protein TsaE
VEWGAGLAESLSTDRIEIDLTVDAETEERYAVARLLLPNDQVQMVESVLNSLGGQRC